MPAVQFTGAASPPAQYVPILHGRQSRPAVPGAQLVNEPPDPPSNIPPSRFAPTRE